MQKFEVINNDDQDEDGGKEIKKAKGVKKYVVKKRHQTQRLYVSSRRKNYYHQTASIQSCNYQVFKIKQSKKYLTPYGDNRYILEDGITALPYGHKIM